ncbi:hypothetical protein [Neobacillus massiliamazoniensis]|uniref:VCBS repeat-containing protein n=1 Tax=Neobacillus massiliamazoniensis TaxID=1499688 RepID=A0A0U1NVC6_9BACI|nr:hypothetical protein [Neobacillus massiliamazoniensis]CRK81935.1 hypothetical protein BN000_01853 [Neobacillus massiliamazoniensis]
MLDREREWVLSFLPYGSELLYTDTNPKQALLHFVDLDGDGKLEAIGIMRTNQQLQLFTLKEYYGHLRIISILNGPGYQVSYLGTAHIKSQNKVSIVVGWKVASIWSQLSIYEWTIPGLIEEKLNGDFIFSKIEVEDMPGLSGRDGKAEIALWFHDKGEAYTVEVYRWDGGKFILAKDVEPYYFKKVAAYYKQQIKEHPDHSFYYPYLHDAEQKASVVLRARPVLKNRL